MIIREIKKLFFNRQIDIMMLLQVLKQRGGSALRGAYDHEVRKLDVILAIRFVVHPLSLATYFPACSRPNGKIALT
jgi:hypothetical protein